MLVQRAISSIVRPQPRQRPIRASRVQILTQGVSVMCICRGDHKHSGWERNCAIVARLEDLGAGAEQPPGLEMARVLPSGFLFTV
jgi:hypothetical protein